MRASRTARLLVAVAVLLVAAPSSAGVLIRVYPKEAPVGCDDAPQIRQIARVGNETWILSDSGVFRVEGHRAEPVRDNESARVIHTVNGRLVLGTATGLLELEDGRWSRLNFPPPGAHCEKRSRLNIEVTSIAERDGIGWVGTDCGLARLEDDRLIWFHSSPVRAVRRVKMENRPGADIWVGGTQSVYRIDEEERRIAVDLGESVEIDRIDLAEDAVWLVGTSQRPGALYDRLFRIEDDQSERIESDKFTFVLGVESIDQRAWLATDAGVFKHNGSSDWIPVLIGGLREPVNTVARMTDPGGRQILWVGSTERSYRQIDDRPAKALPIRSPLTRKHQINIKEIVAAGNLVWLRTDREVFRYEEQVSLIARPDTTSVLGLRILAGRVLSFAEYGYRDENGADPFGKTVTGEVRVALRWQREDFFSALGQPLVPARDFQSELPMVPGPRRLHFIARDDFGNTTPVSQLRVVVVPWSLLKWVFVAVAWLALGVIAVFGASRISSAMNLLQNPARRNRATLGAVPIVLSFLWLRRMILRPYLRNLQRQIEKSASSEDDGVHAWDVATDQQIPMRARIRELAEKRWLEVVPDGVQTLGGQPFIEGPKLYLRKLHDRLATDESARGSVGGAIPILIKVRGKKEGFKGLQEDALRTLGGRGGITDAELGKRLLAGGGFVFLLDAIGSLDSESAQVAIEEFRQTYRTANYLVLAAERPLEEAG